MTIRKSSKLPLSNAHLEAAILFARSAWQVRNEDRFPHLGAPPEYHAHVVAAVVFAVAFLEAWVNEFISDMTDAGPAPTHFPHLSSQRFTALVASGVDVDRAAVLEKYQWCLATADCDLFVKGAKPFQDAHQLTRLRNELIHFTPRWIEYGDDDKGLARGLEQRFGGDGHGLFLHSVLCYELAVWGIRSAVALVEEFSTRMGLTQVLPSAVREKLQEL